MRRPTSFLIEFRLHGFARQYARWVKARVHKEAKRLKKAELKFPNVEHITLFGGAKTQNIRRVEVEVGRTCQKCTLVPFKIGGFDGFQNKDASWLYLDVEPSSDLEQLRYELAQTFIKSDKVICDTCKSYDHDPKYKFHCATGKYAPGNRDKFERLVEFARAKCTLEAFRKYRASVFERLLNAIKKYVFRIREDSDLSISQHLLRVSVLGKGSRIQCEYDLVLKRFLSRREALSGYWWRKTIECLKIELRLPREDWLAVSDKVYFIGDCHFDHENIMKYCRREFKSVENMNVTMANRWNSAVKENDKVYFLGDYTGPPSRNVQEYRHRLERWYGRLKGNKISILGNHDRPYGCVEFEKARILHFGGNTFLIVHDPSDKKNRTIQGKYDWVIHGHKHNNNMENYPFINGERKTINVSAELLNYKPVSINKLIKDLNLIKRMDTVDSQPEKW